MHAAAAAMEAFLEMGETLDKDLVVKSTRHRVLAWGNRLFDDDEKGYQFTAATFGIMRVKNAYFEDGTPEAGSTRSSQCKSNPWRTSVT